jgi:hypothetical protein
MVLKFVKNVDSEFMAYKEDPLDKSPQMMVLPQNYPQDIYVASTKDPMPLVMKLFVGGMSAVGLYIVYRFMELDKK